MSTESDVSYFSATDVVITGSITPKQFAQLELLQAIKTMDCVKIDIQPYCTHAYYQWGFNTDKQYAEWLGALSKIYQGEGLFYTGTAPELKAYIGRQYVGRFSASKGKATIIIWRDRV